MLRDPNDPMTDGNIDVSDFLQTKADLNEKMVFIPEKLIARGGILYALQDENYVAFSYKSTSNQTKQIHVVCEHILEVGRRAEEGIQGWGGKEPIIIHTSLNIRSRIIIKNLKHILRERYPEISGHLETGNEIVYLRLDKSELFERMTFDEQGNGIFSMAQMVGHKWAEEIVEVEVQPV